VARAYASARAGGGGVRQANEFGEYAHAGECVGRGIRNRLAAADRAVDWRRGMPGGEAFFSGRIEWAR
jgi:hypothetical protein